MAETLTFDNTTEQTSADNLTSEEQESLQLGEQIQEQESQLLAGKYENAQQLEKAYIELQKKLGSEDKADTSEAEQSEESDQSDEKEESDNELPEEFKPHLETLKSATEEFKENGKLSEETLDKFNEMSSKELMQVYFSMYDAAKDLGADVGVSPGFDLTEAAVNKIQNSVGGETKYKQLLGWANNNMADDSLKSFDRLVAKGDAAAIQMAVDGIKAQYDYANGYEGRMLTGKPPKGGSDDVYRSQAEVVAAMSDPKYDLDPAYRQDVVDKLARSDVQF
tara:strand:+ start:320 stop:1156 length:837 start_codon:yes stop_codon:yes gene_type:complete